MVIRKDLLIRALAPALLCFCLWASAARADDTTPTLTQFQAYQAVAQQMISALNVANAAAMAALLPSFDQADNALAQAFAIARLRVEAALQYQTPAGLNGIDLIGTENLASGANFDRGLARSEIDDYLDSPSAAQATLTVDALTSAVQSCVQASATLGPLQRQLAGLSVPPLLLLETETTSSVTTGAALPIIVTVGNIGDTTATNVRLEIRRDALGQDSYTIGLGNIGPMALLSHQLTVVAPKALGALPLMLNVYSDNTTGTSSYVEVNVTTGGP